MPAAQRNKPWSIPLGRAARSQVCCAVCGTLCGEAAYGDRYAKGLYCSPEHAISARGLSHLKVSAVYVAVLEGSKARA